MSSQSGAATSATTSADPVLARRVPLWGRIAAIVGLLLLTAVVTALVTSGRRQGYLDPAGVNPSGARALAELLQGQGVAVREVRTVEQAARSARPGDTVLVTEPDLVPPDEVDWIVSSGADVVLVQPGSVLDAFSFQIGAGSNAAPEELAPRCDLREAVRAGSARLGGTAYQAPSAELCYPANGEAFLVVDSLPGGARLVVLGTADPLTNEYLDEDGNAALALGLLGRNSRLVWYRPGLEVPPAQGRPLVELLPGWVAPVVWQLGILAVLVAWWRSRRLGRVVTEPLPVIVRAAEATEGRARLYRRGHARAHAAGILRDAAIGRLRSHLGLPRDAGPDAVAVVVAERTGRPSSHVHAVLAGPPPPDDAALVQLADRLDRIEQEVRIR